MKQKILELLACPKCKAALVYDKKNQQLICTVENTGYPINDGIPQLVNFNTTSSDSICSQ